MPTQNHPAQSRAELYTCVDKGGRYELIGQALGAGHMRGLSNPMIYRDKQSGQLYAREPADFTARMRSIDAAPRADHLRDATKMVLPAGEIRRVVTDALIGMIVGVSGMSPPQNEAPPPFIQAAIDRATDRIFAMLAAAPTPEQPAKEQGHE